MKNLLNIDDVVTVSMPGFSCDGAVATINMMQKFDDGVVHYTGLYHQSCPDGGVGYDNSVQFTYDQVILVEPQSGEKVLSLTDVMAKVFELEAAVTKIQTELLIK